MKKLSKKELNDMGCYYDSIAGTDAEKEEWGDGFTLAELGDKSALEFAEKLLEMRARGENSPREVYSFRLPVVLVEGLKRKAKAEHKSYQRLVNDALWAVVG